jgi:hypothetical protein
VGGPEDVEGAAVAVRKLVDNPGVRRELSDNAKKRTMGLTISNLTADLDKALNTELIKERGLIEIPIEARTTLSSPENVLKSWSSGSWGIIATEKRLFIKRGFLSRKVTEIPFKNISSIEYMRRYSWKTLVLGAAISVLLFTLPFSSQIFSSAFVAGLEGIVRSIFPQSFLQSRFLGAFVSLLQLLPFLITVAIFAIQARTGYTLRGPGVEAIYLPREFRESIAFVRNMQNSGLYERESRIYPQKETMEIAGA